VPRKHSIRPATLALAISVAITAPWGQPSRADGLRDIVMAAIMGTGLVADAFVAWIDNDFAVLRRFQGHSSLATYLAVVSRRVVARRMSQLRLFGNHPTFVPLQHDPATQETSHWTRDDLSEVEASFGNLTATEATAIRMFHLEGRSYSDIGTHIGMAENSIGPFLSKAREKMQRSRD
jgi:RNA polymerase sigma-70 factor (ECF subfamily)